MRFFSRKILFLIVGAVFVAGCATSKVDMAFEGKLTPAESNRAIASYCVTCHVHRNFDSDSHIFDVKYQYKDKKYAGKEECRTCHTYSKDWLMDTKRGTHRPM